MANISEWAITAAGNNTGAPPDFPVENQSANSVNDTMRENMAAVARWYQDTNGTLVSAGTGNAYALTTNNGHAALDDQSLIVFRADRANTGAATLNVDSLGVRDIRSPSGAPLVSGDILANQIVQVVYDSVAAVYRMASPAAVLPAPAGTKMVFYQAASPTGWTQDATINDQVFRVVSGAGGGTGGSWTISGVTVDGHALTEAEGPVHNHSGSTGSAGNHAHNIRLGGGSGSIVTLDEATVSFDTLSSVSASNAAMDVQGAHTHSVSIGNAGSGQAHSHGLTADGTWRPAYIDVIVATKD